MTENPVVAHGMRPREPQKHQNQKTVLESLAETLSINGYPISSLEDLGFYSHKSLITDGIDLNPPILRGVLNTDDYINYTTKVNKQLTSEKEKGPYLKELNKSRENAEGYLRLFEKMGIAPLRVYSNNNTKKILIGIREPDFVQTGGNRETVEDDLESIEKFCSTFKVLFENEFTPRIISTSIDFEGARDIEAEYVLLNRLDFNSAVTMAVSYEKRRTVTGQVDESLEGRRAFHGFLQESLDLGASDIHIEPYGKNGARVRYRADGLLRQKFIPRSVSNKVIGVIKVDSHGMKTDEFRRAQDGVIMFGPEHGVVKDEERLELEVPFMDYNLRTSIIPTRSGEKAVLRLLKLTQEFNINSLGFEKPIIDGLLRAIKSPNGITIITGPTGSGKTTTAYSLISMLNTQERNICTIEDPVEITMDGINQTNVNPNVDMTFASYLKFILRQDPDMVFIGEIRDGETANAAMQISKVGRQVLATMHTNTATAVMERLKDITDMTDIQSYLRAVFAQRLLRKNCPNCLSENHYNIRNDLSLLMREDLGKDLFVKLPKQITPEYQKTNKHCEICDEHGYRGRIPITELWTVDDTARAMMAKHETDSIKYARVAYDSGSMYPLILSGIKRVLEGSTTLEEVKREVPEDQFIRWKKEIIDLVAKHNP
jgi:type II secretory ATPase GspE/PulE/Tfp pilus assembly ATPase PilB-like protein